MSLGSYFIFSVFLVNICHGEDQIISETRPELQRYMHIQDGHIPEGVDVEIVNGEAQPFGSEKYVAECKSGMIRMWPGNSRKFNSKNYMIGGEYPVPCNSFYVFTHRTYPLDSHKKFGFRVTGTFTGPDVAFTSCEDTDYVKISDSEGIEQMWCGVGQTINFETGSNYLEFTFVSQSGSKGAHGFLVTVDTFETCGGLISATNDGPTGYITSPNYPNNYYPNVNCQWYFSSTQETVITLMCDRFVLEDEFVYPNGTSVCLDQLSVTSEAYYPGETIQYCGTNMDLAGKTIYSEGQTLLARFQSDEKDEFMGFNCTYEFIMYAS